MITRILDKPHEFKSKVEKQGKIHTKTGAAPKMGLVDDYAELFGN